MASSQRTATPQVCVSRRLEFGTALPLVRESADGMSFNVSLRAGDSPLIAGRLSPGLSDAGKIHCNLLHIVADSEAALESSRRYCSLLPALSRSRSSVWASSSPDYIFFLRSAISAIFGLNSHESSDTTNKFLMKRTFHAVSGLFPRRGIRG